jgi:uncharacterized protein (TIGR02596 family)
MKTRRGFTLIELLVVMAIMMMVAAFVAPSVSGILRGSQLTQAGQLVLGQLGFARQAAIAQNATIEVRFYKFADPQVPGENPADPSSGKFRAMQAFVVNDISGAVPLGKVRRLPQGAIIDSSSTLSSIFDQTKRAYNTAPTVAIPGVALKYCYYTVRFYADGSPDLSPTIGGTGQKWFFTIHNVTDGDGRSVAPANFWAIQIDPYNGVSKDYRP